MLSKMISTVFNKMLLEKLFHKKAKYEKKKVEDLYLGFYSKRPQH